MKTIYTLLILCLATPFCIGQTNETAAKHYKWKGTKTEAHEGYIVLKSGKRMEGTISLKGTANAVEEVHFVGDGKDIKFPAQALNAYGLTVATSINDTPHLFEWKSVGTVMGKYTENTKPRQGYLIDSDGTNHTGEIQLVKQDNVFAIIKIKTADGKLKFKPSAVKNYGISLSIAGLTKNGTKTYKDEGRNFHPAQLTLRNGNTVDGWVAFQKKTKIDSNKPGLGDKWVGVYYAKEKSGGVRLINSGGVKSITKTTSTGPLEFIAFEGGFILPEAMEGKDYKDPTKEFNAGQITLKDGTVVTGDIAQVKAGGRAFPVRLMFKKGAEAGAYEPKEVASFYQTIEGSQRNYMNYRNMLVELEEDGSVFRLYRNPFPTRTNKFLTGLTSFAIDVAASQGSSAIAKGGDEAYSDAAVDSVIQTSSTEELIYIRDGLVEAAGYANDAELLEKSQNDKLNRYVTAINLEIAGRTVSSSVEIKSKEWIIENKQSGEKIIFYKGNYKDQIEILLMGCYTYLELDKKTQRDYLSPKEKSKAVEMLNGCY